MPICNCENCKYCQEHEEGLMCTKTLIFVDKEDTCLDWDDNEFPSLAPLVFAALVAIIATMFLVIF